MRLQIDAAPDELAVFLEEAEEQLQLLDQGTLLMEREGPNPGLLQEVFRAAHTLKGSSAAIGHDRMAILTHMMEGLLDYLRKGKLEVSTALIDLLLQSLDALRVLKEEVATLDHSGFDPSSLVASLKQFTEDNLATRNDTRLEGGGIAAPTRTRSTTQLGDASQPNFRISVRVANEAVFPAARLLQVQLALADIGTIIESTPSKEDLEEEIVSSEMTLTLNTSEDADRVRKMVTDVPDVEAAQVTLLEAQTIEANQQQAPSSNHSSLEAESNTNMGDSRDNGLVREETASSRQIAVKGAGASKTVRIDIERLDALMNLVGELVIDCTRLGQLSSHLQARDDEDEIAQGVCETSSHIQRITDELQDSIMRARMFPVNSLFSRFPRLIRDLAQRAGKKIELVMEGGETELDRSVIEEIGDPLIHLLRNAVDHGIEPPEDRIGLGKPEIGTIRLTACHRENRIVLTLEDDGKGIDPVRLRDTAQRKGTLSAEIVGRMSDREVLETIFIPGFSTAERISDISGRGVGMDIVKTNIEKLNGTVCVESTPGSGCKFTLELPLTLAIMDALLVGLNGDTFAIPLASVAETLRLRSADVKSVNREKVIQLRGRVLPLLTLRRTLGIQNSGDDFEDTHVVVVGAENDRIGLLVDSLIGEQPVVVKSLGKYIGDVQGISGATILGDGRVALILDVPGLMRRRLQKKVRDAIHA